MALCLQKYKKDMHIHTYTHLKESGLTPPLSQTWWACFWAWLCDVPLIHVNLAWAVTLRAGKSQAKPEPWGHMSQTSNHLESLTWLTLLDMHHIIIRYAQQKHLVLPRLNPFTNTRTYAPNFCLLNMGHSLLNEMKIDWCCHKTRVIYLFFLWGNFQFSFLSLPYFLTCHPLSSSPPSHV